MRGMQVTQSKPCSIALGNEKLRHKAGNKNVQLEGFRASSGTEVATSDLLKPQIYSMHDSPPRRPNGNVIYLNSGASQKLTASIDRSHIRWALASAPSGVKVDSTAGSLE